MIFDRLVLHNFGVYRGRQAVDLAPPSRAKPVILLGGLNGNGKTTFLDGIHLALYGKRARCSGRKNLPYEEFLIRTIHKGVDVHEGAALELEFRSWESGNENRYRLHRSWSANGGGVRERVEVWKNDRYDRPLSESWGSQVEEFIPLGVSGLLLFDGEQIEQLADIENAQGLLESAINSLLGLTVVDQLAADLAVLEQRKRLALRPDAERKNFEEEERRIKLKFLVGSSGLLS
jgi:DNA sulfur modification protein DndD